MQVVLSNVAALLPNIKSYLAHIPSVAFRAQADYRPIHSLRTYVPTHANVVRSHSQPSQEWWYVAAVVVELRCHCRCDSWSRSGSRRRSSSVVVVVVAAIVAVVVVVTVVVVGVGRLI